VTYRFKGAGGLDGKQRDAFMGVRRLVRRSPESWASDRSGRTPVATRAGTVVAPARVNDRIETDQAALPPSYPT